MPAIKSIDVGKNSLTVTDLKGTYTFDISKIPGDKKTVKDVEDYLNTTWLPSVASKEYQIQVHVFSISPLNLTVYTADLGQKIPDNWWVDQS